MKTDTKFAYFRVCGFVEPKKLAEIIYNVSKYIA